MVCYLGRYWRMAVCISELLLGYLADIGILLVSKRWSSTGLLLADQLVI